MSEAAAYTSDDEYHADHARVSATMLRTFVKSVPEYVARFVDHTMPGTSTARMDLGTAVHAAVLQPDCYHELVAVAPELDRRTKAGKDAYAAFEQAAVGKLVIDAAAGATTHAMAEAVRRVPLCRFLLNATGIVERPIWWTDAATGVDCRAKPDLLLTNADTVVELKTVSDPNPFAFARTVWSLGYHLQAVHYMAGTGATRLVCITVSTAPPHEVALFELDEQSLEAARGQYGLVLAEIGGCRLADEWPTVPTAVAKISLPSWAKEAT